MATTFGVTEIRCAGCKRTWGVGSNVVRWGISTPCPSCARMTGWKKTPAYQHFRSRVKGKGPGRWGTAGVA